MLTPSRHATYVKLSTAVSIQAPRGDSLSVERAISPSTPSKAEAS
jgi:hypothetical protein